MSRRSLPPGQEHDANLASRNSGPVDSHSDKYQNIDDGYVDTEYRTVSQPEMGLADYVGVILRRKKTVLAVFLAVFVIGAVYTFIMAPVYQSLATLELEKETGASLSNLGDALTGGLGGGTENEVFATQIGIIKDRNIAETDKPAP